MISIREMLKKLFRIQYSILTIFIIFNLPFIGLLHKKQPTKQPTKKPTKKLIKESKVYETFAITDN